MVAPPSETYLQSLGSVSTMLAGMVLLEKSEDGRSPVVLHSHCECRRLIAICVPYIPFSAFRGLRAFHPLDTVAIFGLHGGGMLLSLRYPQFFSVCAWQRLTTKGGYADARAGFGDIILPSILMGACCPLPLLVAVSPAHKRKSTVN